MHDYIEIFEEKRACQVSALTCRAVYVHEQVPSFLFSLKLRIKRDFMIVIFVSVLWLLSDNDRGLK